MVRPIGLHLVACGLAQLANTDIGVYILQRLPRFGAICKAHKLVVINAGC